MSIIELWISITESWIFIIELWISIIQFWISIITEFMRFWISMESQKRINPIIMGIHNQLWISIINYGYQL